eukprot:SAG31_NODE_642_length_13301_cov_14.143084_22_plen_81_part_00
MGSVECVSLGSSYHVCDFTVAGLLKASPYAGLCACCGRIDGKNADRHRTEAQPVAAVPRMTHKPGISEPHSHSEAHNFSC